MPAITKKPERELMTPGEVALMFRVDPKTVTRWAKQGKLPCIFTPGGHRRYDKKICEDYLARLSAPTN